MTEKLIKCLFFLERGLHVPILKPIWEYVISHGIGEVGLYSLPYRSPKDNDPGIGINEDSRADLIGQGLKFYDVPEEFEPEFTFVADHTFNHVDGLGRIINLGHGTISKGYFYLNDQYSLRENIADMICVPGTLHEKILSQVVFKSIAVTGMPKLDHVDKINDKKDFFAKHDLDLNQPTVLLAPTFNHTLSILPFIGEDLRKFIPLSYNIIVKLHGATSQTTKQSFKQYACQNQNIDYSEDEDISKMFSYADVLVSDVSSVIYEFSSFKKPVVVFDSPLISEFENYREDLIEFKFRDVGVRINQVEDLKGAIQKALFLDLKEKVKYEKVSQDFISVADGTSTKRVIDAVLKMKEKPLSRSIICMSSSSEFREKIKRMSKKRYHLIDLNSGSNGLNYINSVNNLTQLIHSLSEIVIYVDGDDDLSPHFFEMLTAHLEYDETIDVISPLISSCEMDSKFQPYQFGIQLGYEFIGQSLKVQKISKRCFAFRKSLLLEFMEYCLLKQEFENEQSILRVFENFIDQKGKKISIAFDALMCDPHFKSIESVNSIIQNLFYFKCSNVEGNLFKIMIGLIEEKLKSANPVKKNQHLISKASFYCSIKEFQKAKNVLKMVENMSDIKDKNLKGRYYYYLGYIHYKLKKFDEGRKFLKMCLTYIPNHFQAKELLK